MPTNAWTRTYRAIESCQRQRRRAKRLCAQSADVMAESARIVSACRATRDRPDATRAGPAVAGHGPTGLIA